LLPSVLDDPSAVHRLVQRFAGLVRLAVPDRDHQKPAQWHIRV